MPASNRRCWPRSGAEVAQLAIHPVTLHHGFDAETGLLMEGDIAHAKRLGLGEIGHTGIAAVAGGLAWRLAVAGDVALQHRQKTLSIGRIASLDNDVEDQAAATGRQIDL